MSLNTEALYAPATMGRWFKLKKCGLNNTLYMEVNVPASPRIICLWVGRPRERRSNTVILNWLLVVFPFSFFFKVCVVYSSHMVDLLHCFSTVLCRKEKHVSREVMGAL